MANQQFSHINLRSIAHEAMRTYGFYSFFPVPLLDEVETLKPEEFLERSKAEVKDLRELLWSSIDNHESLDLDQLGYCERAPNREIRVLIAIADVDGLVPKSSLCDKHASHNGTSVYAGIEIFSMLPERLSTDLTSLKQDEDRLAIVIEYFVRKDGSLRSSSVYRALVLNKAKLVYETIGEWLEGKSAVPEIVQKTEGLEEQVRLQNEASERLHFLRMDNGALELETIEAKVVIENEAVRDLRVKAKNKAHLIIENFMIAANQTMTWFLEKNDSPTIQRVLKVPDRWDRIVSVASSLGEDLTDEPDARALSDFLARQRDKDPERFPDLSLTIVKLLGAAEYMYSEPGRTHIGHFGLAVSDYIHSTAPNRRYVDLIIQRLIKAMLIKKNTPYTKTELHDIAMHCTDRSQAAKRVERFMRKAAACLLLSDQIGKTFEGIVTGASEKGTYVRLISPPAEGRVIRGERGMDVGENVSVRLIRLDPEKGFIDFEGVRHP